ncbi:MAG TPA: sigma 54-interacting transcriptional regulator [Patescibacteria group bacterium]
MQQGLTTVHASDTTEQVPATASKFNYIFTSSIMSALARRIEKIAVYPRIPVLITGETGVGKEAAARYLYQKTRFVNNRNGPFLKVNVSGIPDSLFEDQLFGHEQGAFTDAKTLSRGLLEQTQRGAVFLDEIAELTWVNQVKLLNFLDDYKIRRLSGTKDIAVDARVISATNAELPTLVAQKKFREDLYYRLTGYTLVIPPLREHLDDIPFLVAEFIQKINHENRCEVSFKASDNVIKLLRMHSWPGNVRELYHAVERAVLNCDGEKLTPEDFELQQPIPKSEPQKEEWLGSDRHVNLIVEEHILAVMRKYQGNVTRASGILGYSRHGLSNKLSRIMMRRAEAGQNDTSNE